MKLSKKLTRKLLRQMWKATQEIVVARALAGLVADVILVGNQH